MQLCSSAALQLCKRTEQSCRASSVPCTATTRRLARPLARRLSVCSEPRSRSQPAGVHAFATSSECALRLCLAGSVACASEFKPLARPESEREQAATSSSEPSARSYGSSSEPSARSYVTSSRPASFVCLVVRVPRRMATTVTGFQPCNRHGRSQGGLL